MGGMNLSQLKQYIQNNLWYGESGRQEHLHAAVVSLVMPDTSKVFGIDISHWNIPPVDIQRMKDLYSLDFVIIKGCDGSINSRYYEEHKAACKSAGVPFGMYVWLYRNANVSIDTQVNAWAARYKADPPPMGLYIDAEWTSYGGQPSNPSANDLRMAHDKWKVKTGKTATTYTAKGYADQYLIGFDWSREPLWVANYGVSTPNLPTGASTYKIWQFTSTLDGSQLDPGGNLELDGNYYNGTHEQFSNEYGGTTPPPSPDVITYPYDGVKQSRGERYA
jgi:GH25 family lysozyme M1 (1,4-beta-N-acetylmuramidase)